MSKPKIAFFDFTSCEGCQLQVLNCEDELLDILGAVEIVQFREAIDDRRNDYDIAFVEGAFTRESDRARLEEIRKNAKIVVALAMGIAEQGAGILPNEMLDGLGTVLDTAVDLGKIILGTGHEGIEDISKGITNGLKDLLKPKKQE